nr:hypothetical protein [Tanacetum cinerariifolium]
MESLSPQVVSAVKLPILNPNEFDLWKMRIEQYFLMTDYSLWEVILNGDSPAPTRVIKGVLQPVAPTTAEQRLARKNELNARGTLLMALLDKHQLKFNTHKDGKTLMEAIEKRSPPTKWRTHIPIWRNKTDLEEQSLDDLFNSLKICEAEVKNSSSASTSTQNIAFVSSSNTDSTNEPVSAAASVSAVSAKIPIDADDLEEMDRKWQMSMKGHFTKECRSPKYTRINGAAKPQRRNVPVETSTSNKLVSQCNGVVNYDWSFQADEEPTNYALMASLLQVLLLIMSLPPSPIYDRYQSGNGHHVVPPSYTGTFMPSKPDLVFHNAPNDDETVHTAFNVELSPTKPDNDLSHTHRPSAPIIEDWVSNSEDESETNVSQNIPSFVQPTEQVKSLRPSVQHVETTIPATNPKTASSKPKSKGTSRNRKACFMCKSLTHLIKDCDYHEKKMAQPTARNHAQRGNHKPSACMTLLNPQRHVVLTTVLTQSKLVHITAVRPVTTVVPKFIVTRPRQANTIVTKPHLPPRRHINHSPTPTASTFPLKVTAVKALMVNAAKGV